MKCYQCGEEIQSEGRFCQFCGSDLAVSEQSTLLMANPHPEFLETAGLKSELILNKRFRIIKPLGEGGMGQIYLAEDTKLRRKVAIKSISDAKSNDPISRGRFLREAQVVSQLEHTNICTVYEFFEEEERSYFVMQYIEGVTLNQVIRSRTLSMSKVLNISLQICEALIEAHGHGVVHRDIKPTNIMINRKGQVIVLDFGLAKFKNKLLETDTSGLGMKPTEKGMVLGTVPYMSPEQARGEELDFRSDIFSFGTLLFECIHGEHPFAGKEQIETLYNILKKNPEYSDSMPELLKVILEKALAKNCENRYASFEELRADLKAFSELPDILQTMTPAEKKEGSGLSKSHKDRHDSENLSEMVKGLKPSSSPVVSGGVKKRSWLKPMLWTSLGLVALFLAFYVFLSGSRETQQSGFILLEKFENQTEDKQLEDQIHLLLAHSINQFPSIQLLTRADIGVPDNAGPDEFLQKAQARFTVSHKLTGTITHKTDYSIDAELMSVDDPTEKRFIPITGPDKDSILTFQVDFIAKDIYRKIMGTEPVTFRRTQDTFGDNWEDLLTLTRGMHYFEMLETQEAQTELRKVEYIPMARYILADLCLFNGQEDKGLKELESLYPKLDLLTEGLQLRIKTLKARMDFNFLDQKAYLLQLEQLFPFSKDIYFELGEGFFHMGLADKAIEYYNKALELDPDFSKVINHLGYCYSYLGLHKEAIECFQRYRRFDDTANSYDSLGDGYFFSGDLELCIQFKSAAIRKAEKSVGWAYLTLADVYILQARFEQAKRALQAYIEAMSEPEEDNSYYQAEIIRKEAYIRYLDRDYAEAVKLIDQSLQLFDSKVIRSDSGESHWLKGLINLRRNRLPEAKTERQWLKDFVDTHGLSQDNFSAPLKYWIHLDALIQETEGHLDLAENRFNELLHLKPQLSYWTTPFDFPFFQSEYAAFLLRCKQVKKCQDALNTCFDFDSNYLPALWIEYELKNLKDTNESIQVLQRIKFLYGDSDENNIFRSRLKQELE